MKVMISAILICHLPQEVVPSVTIKDWPCNYYTVRHLHDNILGLIEDDVLAIIVRIGRG